jgi:hypothetical protein
LSVGTLYELDGMKGGPIKHGSTSPESLLQVLHKFLEVGTIYISLHRLKLMVL